MTAGQPTGLQHTPARFRTSDPEQISHYMSDAFRPNRSALLRRESRADFCHRGLRLGDASIHQVRYGRAASVDAPVADGIYLAMFTLSGAAEVDQGDARFCAGAGSFCVLNPGRHLRIRLSGDFEQLTVRLQADSLRRALLESADCDLREELSFIPRACAVDTRNSSFAMLVDTICRDMSREDAHLDVPAVASHLEQVLGGLLVNEFAHTYSDQLRSAAFAQATPAIVRRAEDYMRAHLGAEIALQDVADAAGCSPRSLQQAFRRFRQTTPSAWLRLRRLERARELLLDSRTPAHTVTDVALACGFTHLSKFAAHYRQRFGETPLQTRRHGHGKRCAITKR